jgi:hypothetical protein
VIAIRDSNAANNVEIDPRSVRLLTASEQAPQVNNRDEDQDGEDDESNNDKLRFENLKAKFDLMV